MMYRYVFQVNEFDAVVYSEFEPEEVIKAIKYAHDKATGWFFENRLFLSANAMQDLCLFVEGVEDGR